MTLEQLRNAVDQINGEIIALFSKRLKMTQLIAKVKKETGLPVDDLQREEEQRGLLRKLAQDQDISPAIVEEMFEIFVDYSKLRMKMEMSCKKERQ